MTNPNVYPITAAFEEFVKKELKITRLENISLHPDPVLDLAVKMAENLGDYEHGTASPEDLLPEPVLMIFKAYGISKDREDSAIEGKNFSDLALEILSAVYQDLLLTVIHSE